LERTLIGGGWEQDAQDNVGFKREDVTEGWIKLHNEEFHNL
jgi:hypothetical protein